MNGIAQQSTTARILPGSDRHPMLHNIGTCVICGRIDSPANQFTAPDSPVYDTLPADFDGLPIRRAGANSHTPEGCIEVSTTLNSYRSITYIVRDGQILGRIEHPETWIDTLDVYIGDGLTGGTLIDAPGNSFKEITEHVAAFNR